MLVLFGDAYGDVSCEGKVVVMRVTNVEASTGAGGGHAGGMMSGNENVVDGALSIARPCPSVVRALVLDVVRFGGCKAEVCDEVV